jgi:acetoin utilization protein AcuC
MRRAAFVYSDQLSRHVLREDHVMRPTRLRYTYELLDGYGAFQASRLVEPRPATEEELLWFHTPDYVRAVRGISRGERGIQPQRYNFDPQGDNPPYEGMWEAGLLATGGTLVAAELVADGKVDVAFNVAGGLHHAAPDHTSGFCIFNDPVIAIEYLRRRGLRACYVDIDCHHGDGVQDAYYGTDEVLTISMHESGRYLFPGTGEAEDIGTGRGRGYAVNVPLAPYTGDEAFTWAFRQVVPPLVKAFKPDVIVTQLGIDTHFNDPITHLQLTVEGHAALVQELGALAPKWVALGGGGYDIAAVTRGWALDYGVMMEAEWPDAVPVRFRESYGIERLRDGGAPALPHAVRLRTRAFAELSVETLRRLVFPLHGLA